MKLRRFSSLSFRNLGSRLQRTILTAIGIVLGVGIVFGVLTLSNTMSSTFKDLFLPRLRYRGPDHYRRRWQRDL